MARASWVLLPLLLAFVGAQWDPNNPGRHVGVHLFEWRWTDIAAECERFLGPNGFAGAQVSPPNENVIVFTDSAQRPWWERYQPVSYNLNTRSGTEEEFADMVSRCNAAGVRIYVDAILNHMSGKNWPSGTPSTAGSAFDGTAQDYPAVPYSSASFHGADKCPTASGNVEDYMDPVQVRNCHLIGLNDLDQSQEAVKEKLVAYLNKLIGYGVAGFRIDAAKYMWPEDLKAIFDGLNDLPTEHGFAAGSRPFVYQEVIDFDTEAVQTSEYVGNGRVTEFKYGRYLGEALRNRIPLKDLFNFGEAWGLENSEFATAFIDNHDNQRGQWSGSPSIITFREEKLYKIANAFMLAHPYGFPVLMSSYFWEQNIVNGVDLNDWVGPPHDENFGTLPVTITPDGQCSDGWVCEHRWPVIARMVKFRNVVEGTSLTGWWDNGSNQIAFCRGDKGFIAINNEDTPLEQNINICLPPGTYCDVISGSLENGTCTGKSVVVDADGRALISIPANEDGVLAIHVESRVA